MKGSIAVAAARKYDRVVQMGAQRRSAPVLTQGIEQLHEGIIGRVYLAKTWYTNNRKSNFFKPARCLPGSITIYGRGQRLVFLTKTD